MLRWLRQSGGKAAPAAAYRPCAHVLAARADGRTILLDPMAGRYWGLDPVAGEIWTALEDGCTVEQTVQRLVARFDAEPAVLEADTRAFLAELTRSRLVEAA